MPKGNRLKNSVSAPLTFDAKPSTANRGPTADRSQTADRGTDINEINRRFWDAQGVHTTPTHDAAPIDDINERHRRFWAAQAAS
ncbi:hypothetical protein [Burkholderia sp. ABCPW 11]|uniref:hypothetical protein n=1 Tax=Burkholderia sp. ABCPW 11 TaxID=1637859 RepID=UPI0012FD5AAB|nr:hypothetical protein [Burkholderia sp. ABCPW 11]